MEVYYYERDALKFKTTDEELDHTPSLADGVSVETEYNLRAFGCQFIQQESILLRLPQIVSATAQIFFHRFFTRRSMKRFEVKLVGTACVFLATKVDEELRRVRELLSVHWALDHSQPLDLHSTEYWALKDELLRYEQAALEAFGYMLHVELPHKFLVTYLSTLGLVPHADVTQRSWNYVNDALRSDVCLRVGPQTLACAAIHLAARDLGRRLPKNPPWWRVFQVSLADLERVCHAIHCLYAAKPSYVPLELLNKPGPEHNGDKKGDGGSAANNGGSKSEDKQEGKQDSKPEGKSNGQAGRSRSRSPRRYDPADRTTRRYNH